MVEFGKLLYMVVVKSKCTGFLFFKYVCAGYVRVCMCAPMCEHAQRMPGAFLDDSVSVNLKLDHLSEAGW